MILYATITSERASKGQGGNDFLEIEVKDENRNNILELKIIPKDDQFILEGYAISQHSGKRSEYYIKYELAKGNKQKGEKCPVCKKEKTNSPPSTHCIPL